MNLGGEPRQAVQRSVSGCCNISAFFPGKIATGSRSLRLVAEGEELETNLLQASQRIPASSGVLDEVFGTHRAC
jgi:hypothetical protein